jgi:two-component system cell cycle response regulator DivK
MTDYSLVSALRGDLVAGTRHARILEEVLTMPTSPTQKTVLLVEDNEDNRIVYSTILRHFGFQVMEALNGEEGIARARAERPDLILMDISIPLIDGWEATQVLKHDPLTQRIPIIALTAHALASDREKAMQVGCDGYLAKPCEPRAVVAEVQRFLGRADPTPVGVEVTAPAGGSVPAS